MELEQHCLRVLRQYDAGEGRRSSRSSTRWRATSTVWDGKSDRTAQYEDALATGPGERCPCGICEEIGIEIAIFRGSERNKRRGFHNLYVFGQRLEATGRDGVVTTAVRREATAAQARTLRYSAFPPWRSDQGPSRTLYYFAVDGKLLPQFTTVSRDPARRRRQSRATSDPRSSPTSAPSAATSNRRTRAAQRRSSSPSTTG